MRATNKRISLRKLVNSVFAGENIDGAEKRTLLRGMRKLRVIPEGKTGEDVLRLMVQFGGWGRERLESNRTILREAGLGQFAGDTAQVIPITAAKRVLT